MSLARAAGNRLPAEQLAARLAGVALAAMLCAGLLMWNPWLSQTIDWALVVPAGLWLAWLTSGSGLRGRSPAFWLITLGLACYLCVLMLSTAAAGLEGQRSFLDYLRAALLCIATVAVFAEAHRHDHAFARYLGRSLTAAAAISSLLLTAAALSEGLLGQGRLNGVPGLNWVLNSNALGGVYAICFATAIGHGLRNDVRTAERNAAFAAALLPLAVVLLTQSRGAILGCLTAVAVAFVALPRRVSLALLGAVAVVTLLMALAFPVQTELFFDRGDSARMELWQHFLELSRERFWLGHGLDFDVTFQIGRSPIHTPHNILLAALVRGGILALAALAVVLVGAAAAAVGAARKGWWLPLVVLAAALVLSTVDHEMVPTSFGFYWYVFWLPLGLAAAAAAEPSGGSGE